MKRIISSLKGNKHALEGILFSTLGVFLLVYSLYNHYQIEVAWKLSPYLFPVLIALLLIVASIGLFLQGRGRTKTNDSLERDGLKRIAFFTGLVFLYYIVLPFLGFIITNILVLSLIFIYLKLRSWWRVALLSIGITLILYLVFQTLLHVRLPIGVF